MSARPSKWIAVLVVAAGLAMAGCGSTNPPCSVNLTEVEAARTEAGAVEARLEALQEERDRLDQQVADSTEQRAELMARKASLQSQIDQLMGGQ